MVIAPVIAMCVPFFIHTIFHSFSKRCIISVVPGSCSIVPQPGEKYSTKSCFFKVFFIMIDWALPLVLNFKYRSKHTSFIWLWVQQSWFLLVMVSDLNVFILMHSDLITQMYWSAICPFLDPSYHSLVFPDTQCWYIHSYIFSCPRLCSKNRPIQRKFSKRD